VATFPSIAAGYSIHAPGSRVFSAFLEHPLFGQATVLILMAFWAG
jgi:hypothetical protein